MTFYTNRTKNDLLLSDIRITIRSEQTIDPLALNPRLTLEELHESESIGSIHKALSSNPPKLLKSSSRPAKHTDLNSYRISESTRPIPNRTKVGISIDPKRKQYIEELNGSSSEDLSKFEDYADGFSEPELEQPAPQETESTTTVTAQPSKYVDVTNVK